MDSRIDRTDDDRAFGAGHQDQCLHTTHGDGADWPASSPARRPAAHLPALAEQQPAEQQPAEEQPAGEAATMAQAGIDGPGLFETLASLQNGHTFTITVAPAETGKIRVTALALALPEKKARATEKGETAPPPLPFEPITCVDTPETFDHPETGIVAAFKAGAEREKSLAEMLEQTRRHERRFAAAQKRMEDAKKKADKAVAAATPEASLFGADAPASGSGPQS